jgi:hypothetical protein
MKYLFKLVLLLGLEPRLTANLASRAYKTRRATLHYRSEMVPSVGIAPTYSVLQTGANLSQLTWHWRALKDSNLRP